MTGKKNEKKNWKEKNELLGTYQWSIFDILSTIRKILMR
jgi:hypothetical protein